MNKLVQSQIWTNKDTYNNEFQGKKTTMEPKFSSECSKSKYNKGRDLENFNNRCENWIQKLKIIFWDREEPNETILYCFVFRFHRKMNKSSLSLAS